jgi:hypothetical protein
VIIEIVVTLAATAAVGAAIYAYTLKRRLALPRMLSIENARELPLLRLAPKISWCKFLENVDDMGRRLASQFTVARELSTLSFTVLRQKFSSTELTYGRYEKILAESNAVLVDNFSKVIPLLEAVDALADAKSNKRALTERIQNLLSLNQDLLDKLNELMTNLSGIKNLSGPDQKTADFLLDNLKTMTERAKLY